MTDNDDNLHRMLNDAGSRWRRSQPRVAARPDLAFTATRRPAPWLPLAAAAATVAVATAAVLVANSTSGRARPVTVPGSSATPAASPQPSSASPAPVPSPTRALPPVPPSFSANDLSFISATRGWALGPAGVVATTDGGAHWRSLPGRPTGASHLRFASAGLGFAYGDISHQVFDVTTDGGTTWGPQTGTSTEALEPGAGGTLRVVRDPACSPPGCPYTIQAAPVGSATFHQVPTPPLVGNAARLARQGDDAYVLVLKNPAGGAGDAHPTFAVSHDRGATWATRPDPCSPAAPNDPAESDAAAFAAAPGGVLGVLCVDRMGGSSGKLLMSNDAAATFARSAALPPHSVDTLALADAAHVCVAVASNSQELLMASSDSGKHWQQVAAEPRSGPTATSGFLAFTTATVGTWVGPDGTALWRTDDAGGTWQRRAFAGP